MRKEKLFALAQFCSPQLSFWQPVAAHQASSKAQKLSWTEAAELTTMDPSKATDRYDADSSTMSWKV